MGFYKQEIQITIDIFSFDSVNIFNNIKNITFCIPGINVYTFDFIKIIIKDKTKFYIVHKYTLCIAEFAQ